VSWQDDLGDLRLLGPDSPEFARIVKRLYDFISKLSKEHQTLTVRFGEHIANAHEITERLIRAEDALRTVRAELDLPEHIAEIVGEALR